MINPVQIIREKRDGRKLPPHLIEAFVQGAVKGTIPEYQVTAFLMATYFQGMDLEETSALTQAMIQSGKQVHFKDQRPKVDKHSTGGVGDKISIILAPLVASLDVDVPMVAGRGLGHTGGTLDKLESIPGFKVRMSLDEFQQAIARHGVAIMGQTEEFVPADKLLYSLRDVTATIECISLMTGSILSKKVAEGITGLVLDIKVGSGAFMKTQKDAEKLAKSLVAVGTKLGLKIRVLITDMSQPLGNAVGNSLEVLECLDVLRGGGPADLRELTVELAAHMLILGDQCTSLSTARASARKNLHNGAALKKFAEMCKSQHASIDVTQKTDALKISEHSVDLVAPKSGTISKMDTEAIGLLVGSDLGGGRLKVTDNIDHSVGLILRAKVGDHVKKGENIATVYYNPARAPSVSELLKRLAASYHITGGHIVRPKIIKKVFSS